jgi:DNA polymerase
VRFEGSVIDITLKAPMGAAAAGQVSANRKKFRGTLERAESGGWQIVWRDEPAVKPGQKVSKKRVPAPLQALGFTLDELRDAIAGFDGLEIKKTASQIVFADGNPKASVMVIGEVPGAEDDRAGKPFTGESGQLLDRIFAAIGLNRADHFYVTSFLNWRPPGNRSPTPSEFMISLPFIERHIALVAPDILLVCSAAAAQALTGRKEGISRVRKTEHIYKPVTAGLESGVSGLPMIVTYSPDYLLQTPLQKRAVWADILALEARLA